MLNRLKHLTGRRRREPLTGAVEAVLEDCREIITAVAALDGLTLGPDDQAVAGKAADAAGEGVSAAYAWAIITLAELSTGDQLDDSQREGALAAAAAAEITDCGCLACGPAAAAAQTLCEHYQHAIGGYLRGLADAGADPYNAINDDPEWQSEMRYLIDGRVGIASHLDAVLRINARYARDNGR